MDCKVGQVLSVGKESIIVSFDRRSACTGCHAKGFCTSADAKEQLLEISDYPEGIKPGDIVEVVYEESMGLKAVFIAFVLPLILLLAVGIILARYGVGEITMILVALATITLYFITLTCFRSRLKKTMKMRARRRDTTDDAAYVDPSL